MLDIEFEPGFVSADTRIDLSEGAISAQDHYLYQIGQLIVALQREWNFVVPDLHPDNLMRRPGGYHPVLIDGPVPNPHGLEPRIAAGDFFAPYITFSTSRFSSLVSGYVWNSMRLIEPTKPGFTKSVLEWIGGRYDNAPVYIPSPPVAEEIAHELLKVKTTARHNSDNSNRDVWSSICLCALGALSSDDLKSAISRKPSSRRALIALMESFTFSNHRNATDRAPTNAIVEKLCELRACPEVS